MASDSHSGSTPLKEMYDDSLLQDEHYNLNGTTPSKFQYYLQKMPKRYIVAIMTFLGFCNVYALRVNLSVAIVAMTNNSTSMVNGSTLYRGPADFAWDDKIQGVALGSFFYGYIITQLPGGFLARYFGGKPLFVGGILATAIFTILTPLCTSFSVYMLIVIRVLEGLCEGVTYPAIHAIWTKWAPPQEKTKLATIGFSGSLIGTMIALPMAGWLAESTAGWPAIFYVFGSLAIVWSVCWWYFIADSPSDHTTISQHELEYITQSIGFTQQQTKMLSTPWKQILTSKAVWAIIIAHFAENWGFYTWLTELPTYLNDVLRFDLRRAGFLSAMPYLFMSIMLVGGGFLADYIRQMQWFSTTMVRKIFTSGAFLVQVVFMIAAGYLQSAPSVIACLTISVGIGGLAWSGFSVNHLDVAPQYASILMGLSNTFATIPGIVSPLVTGVIVTRESSGEWELVFYIAGAIYLVGAILYALMASGERQPWAELREGYIPYMESDDDEANTEADKLK